MNGTEEVEDEKFVEAIEELQKKIEHSRGKSRVNKREELFQKAIEETVYKFGENTARCAIAQLIVECEIKSDEKIPENVLSEKQQKRLRAEGVLIANVFFINKNLDKITKLLNNTDIEKRVAEVLSTLTDVEKHVVAERYGLYSSSPRTFKEMGREFNVTSVRIRQIEAKALRKLSHPTRCQLFFMSDEDIKRRDEEKAKRIEAEKKANEDSIDNLDLSVRAYNCLVRGGTRTVSALLLKTKGELFRIRNFGGASYQEVERKLAELGLETKEQKEQKRQAELSQRIEEEKENNPLTLSVGDLGFSVRTYNGLIRGGMKTVEDLLSRTEEKYLAIRNFGGKSYQEVVGKLAGMGLSIKEQGDEK